ncbi:hypothetical protein [Hyphococcus sp.]|uniref:hypothetical protein n=1 Tax=Hyphococcus sp. TaxID=2038636 RepID=UPI003CCC038F
MILRRIASALKRQDWATVLIEFVLVILGVLIALQVNNWNEERQARSEERRILERLHEELISVQATRSRITDAEHENLRRLYTARKVLFEKIDRQTLTSAECTSLGNSDWPFVQRISVPIIEELLATGRLNLITNDDILTAISALLERQSITDSLLDDLRPLRHELSTEFPALITYAIVPIDDPLDEDGFDVVYTCDVAGMKEDSAFLNAVGENITTFVDSFGSGYLRSRQVFADLHDAVDASLNVTHEDEQ